MLQFINNFSAQHHVPTFFVCLYANMKVVSDKKLLLFTKSRYLATRTIWSLFCIPRLIQNRTRKRISATRFAFERNQVCIMQLLFLFSLPAANFKFFMSWRKREYFIKRLCYTCTIVEWIFGVLAVKRLKFTVCFLIKIWICCLSLNYKCEMLYFNFIIIILCLLVHSWFFILGKQGS